MYVYIFHNCYPVPFLYLGKYFYLNPQVLLFFFAVWFLFFYCLSYHWVGKGRE